VVRPKPANPSGPGFAARNAGDGKAISFSIVLVSSCSWYQLRTHLTYRSVKIDTGKEHIRGKGIAELHAELKEDVEGAEKFVVLKGRDLRGAARGRNIDLALATEGISPRLMRILAVRVTSPQVHREPDDWPHEVLRDRRACHRV
jgi:hypothetical protein